MRPPLLPFSMIDQDAEEAKVKQVKKGIEAGLSLRQIAEEVGTSPSTLTRLMQSNGYEVIQTIIKKDQPNDQ